MPTHLDVSDKVRDVIMYGPIELHILEITARTAATKVPANMSEFVDMSHSASTHIRKYAEKVAQPVMFNNGQYDGIWVTSPEVVEAFASWFKMCPRMEKGVFAKCWPFIRDVWAWLWLHPETVRTCVRMCILDGKQ